MKRVLLFGGLITSLLSAPVYAAKSTTIPTENPLSILKEIPTDFTLVCTGVIVSIDQGGASGILYIEKTGEEVAFINPSFVQLRVGMVVSASVNFCTIWEPPKRKVKRTGAALTSTEDPTTASPASSYDMPTIAIVLAF